MHRATGPSVDLPAAKGLRGEAATVVARPGCTCGCGTIELASLPETPDRHVGGTLPVTGDVYDEAGEIIGGMVIFLDRDGCLYSLEIYTWDDPLQIPDAGRVRWRLNDLTQTPPL